MAERFPNIRALADSWTSDFFYYDLNGTEADPAKIPFYWTQAMQRIQGIRPVVLFTKSDSPLPTTVFVFMPTEGIDPVSGRPGFVLDDIALPLDLAGALNMTGRRADGKVLVQGYSRMEPQADGLNVVYFLAEKPEVIRHEALHLLWYATWPTELCPGTHINTYETVEHGFGCDPFQSGPGNE